MHQIRNVEEIDHVQNPVIVLVNRDVIMIQDFSNQNAIMMKERMHSEQIDVSTIINAMDKECALLTIGASEKVNVDFI